MARIYVSSTFNDLKEFREHVRLQLRQMGHEDIAMEYYVAENQRPLDKCLKDVATCDLYIGIFAQRYGYIPPEQQKSITEIEYRTAFDKRKDRLIFCWMKKRHGQQNSLIREKTQKRFHH